MTGDRWTRLEALVDTATTLAPEARAAFLDKECSGDSDMRREVESLLARETRVEGFLEVPHLRVVSAADLGANLDPASSRLAAGTELGPYRIEDFVGAGGMGSVYRATDPRLARTVAIKVLTTRAASDVDRRRLEKEARAASALNHPHICTVHDIGSEAGTAYLVMEYLDGDTLAEKLTKRGPLPPPQALDAAIQIADALAAAHRAGIVHRDLKPGNIMFVKAGPGRSGQSDVKLLDFGLARNVNPPDAATAADSVRTHGLVFGTVPYMAPEQVAGRPADARTDLFAFGAVLYEMLTGRRAFDSDSQAGVIAAVLEREPVPLTDAQPQTPPALDRLIRKCLAKDPDARWQSASDVADELRWIAEGRETSPGPRRASPRHRARVWPFLVPLVALAGVVIGWSVRRAPAPEVLHVTLSLSDLELTLSAGGVAISPDGGTIAFVARRRQEEPRLYLRRLSEREARPVKGTDGAVAPLFSPDGKWLAFGVDGKLVRVLVDGGERQVICPFDYQGLSRAHWTAGGDIVFGHWPGGVSIVPASGGSPRNLVPSSTRYLLWPHLLPGGRVLLFTVLNPSNASVVALTLATGVQRTIIPDASCARYLPTGHLVYVSEGRLRAVAFDPRTLTTRGESRVVLEDFAFGRMASGAFADYDTSSTGTLVALPASSMLTRLVWRDRSGRTSELPFEPRDYLFPSLSADGRRLTVTVSRWPFTYVWIGSVDGEPLQQLTRRGRDMCSIFSKDGQWVAFTSARDGWSNLFKVRADGTDVTAEPERLTEASSNHKPTSWSRDGRWVLFNDNQGPPWKRDIARVAVVSSKMREPLVRTENNEIEAVLSPDERWIAYQSDESGQWEVYVRPYPGRGGAMQVSVNGGRGPAWNPRGDELFYQTRAALMSVPFRNRQPLRPVRLFAPAWSEEYPQGIRRDPGRRAVSFRPAGDGPERDHAREELVSRGHGQGPSGLTPLRPSPLRHSVSRAPSMRLLGGVLRSMW